MPLSLRVFSNKKQESDPSKDVFRTTTKKKGFFRRVRSSKEKKTAQIPPVEQALTWTMSNDSISPTASESAANVVLGGEEKIVAQPKTYIFTEEEVMQNQLNQFRALSELKTDIHKLKGVADHLRFLHEKEIAKKDDEYVELMIVLEEKKMDLAQSRAELEATKEELATVSVALLRAQHELFERKQNPWRSIFS